MYYGLTNMRKFAVFLHGSGCRIEVEDETGLGLNRRTETMGFYATRFVQADLPEEAVTKAIALVQEELSKVNHPGTPPHIVVESATEDVPAYDAYAPGGGFTWYSEDHGN